LAWGVPYPLLNSCYTQNTAFGRRPWLGQMSFENIILIGISHLRGAATPVLSFFGSHMSARSEQSRLILLGFLFLLMRFTWLKNTRNEEQTKDANPLTFEAELGDTPGEGGT